MKKFLSLVLTMLVMYSLKAQTPQLVNFQGVARNSTGNVVANKNIAIRLTIHDGAANGVGVYTETRNVMTNAFGLFNIVIGSSGAVSSTGSIAAVNWGVNSKYLQLEVDPNGGSTFVTAGTTQLVSTPYALFAEGARPTGTAGGDLTGSFPNPSVAANAITTVKIADANITTQKVADKAIATAKINDSAITSAKIADAAVITSKLGDNAVTTVKITDANITTAKIADNAITTVKIADSGVVANKIADNAVVSSKIAADAVTTAKVADANITTAKIADNAVTAVKISDASITVNKIADNAVVNSKIADDAITAAKIADASITSSQIADNAVTAIKITDASITISKIADNAVVNAKIADDAVSTTKIADANITTQKIADANITTQKIADAAVTDDKLADGISYSKLTGAPTSLPPAGIAGGDLNGTYPNPTIANDAVTSAKISDGTIANADINAAAAIAYSKLGLTNSIQNGDLTANSVTTSKVANGTVTTSKMADSAISGLKLLTHAVQNRHIIDGAVTNNKISAPGANTGDVLTYNGTSVVWTPVETSATGTAGGDLNGTYPNPTIANDAITSAKVADGTIANADINAAAAIGYSKLSLTNSISNGDLTANSVTTSKVANGTVTTSKMADSAISGLKLLTYAVQNRHIIDGAVTNSKISGTGANTGEVLSYNGTSVVWTPVETGATGTAGGDLNGTYPNPTIANDAITSTKISDGTIVNADINAAAAIAYSKLSLTNSIQNGDLTANSVTTSKVANGTVTTSKMADSAISGLKLLTHAVQSRHIIDGAVTNSKISGTGANTGEVLSYNGTSVVWTPVETGATGTAGGDLNGTYPNPTIANDAITSAKVADGTIANADINAAAAIAYSKLSLTNSISNGDITANSVTTSKVANGTVTTSKMADSAISGLKLLTHAVQNRHIIDGAVTSNKISAPGANTGDVLTFDGANVVWTALEGGGTPTGSAGGDLSGTYPNPTVANDAVTSAKISDGTITSTDISVTAAIPYSKLNLINSVSNIDITANAITTSKVANGTVTTSKMADSAISGLKLLTHAVQNRHIIDGAVTNNKISAPGASTGDVLTFDGANVVWTAPEGGGAPTGSAGGDLSGTYPNPTVANDAITSAKISDGTITSADISSTAAIPYSKLSLTNSVSNIDITANAITTSKVANGTVTTSKMADSAISGLKLLTYAVQSRHILDGAVTTSKINPSGAASGDVLTYNGTSVAWTTPVSGGGSPTGSAGGDLSGTYPNPTVANDAVTSAKISDGTITSADISATAAIPYSKLSLTNSVSNIDITANAITTSKVANGTVTTSKMADSAISGLKLLTYAVQSRHILDAAVTIPKINASGSANNGTFLRGDGVWASPSTSGGLVVYTGTTGGAINQTISDMSVRTVMVTFNGGSGAASTIAITIPSAASYTAGTEIRFSVTAYITANPSWTIVSPGSNYSALNFNAASMAGGVTVGATNGFRLVTDGVANWYRVLP